MNEYPQLPDELVRAGCVILGYGRTFNILTENKVFDGYVIDSRHNDNQWFKMDNLTGNVGWAIYAAHSSVPFESLIKPKQDELRWE